MSCRVLPCLIPKARQYYKVEKDPTPPVLSNFLFRRYKRVVH